ncbi:hypothetical protein KBX26_17485 [Micromonospora sp. C97]|uniref:hypothetical protein n=1 Tax=Micromonospora sp. C97 TaxID=2824883 RepID=UPI001B37827B|nr:hypothetical protein [Micromonospora sp. C97]MBQ1031787.1 hypothetical protein [Micromonospora sp. C97]
MIMLRNPLRHGVLALALVLAAANLVGTPALRPTPAEAAPTVVPDDYQFALGFSNTQGANQWSYLQWDGVAYTPMVWEPTRDRWRGNCEFCVISRSGLHPDTNDAVIAWTAPRGGAVTVRGTMDHQTYIDPDITNVDGVRTFVRKRSGGTTSKVWPSADFQHLRPAFMAQHVFTTAVNAGDTLLFHANRAGTGLHDGLSWNPRISYDYEPKFTLDQAELVMNPADFDRIGERTALDASLSVVPNGSQFDFYHSSDFGRQVQKFRGDLARPAQVRVYADTTANRFRNPHGLDGQWWIASVYRTEEGHLLAFCHIENADPQTSGWWAGGLAYSTDNGEHFTLLGKTLAARKKAPDGSTDNIGGMPFVLKDGFFHVYFTEFGMPVVARAPVAEVIDAAKRGTVSPWTKYHGGAWNEPGMHGQATEVVAASPTNSYDSHAGAAYSTYLGKYLLTGGSGGQGQGIFLAFGDDPAHFDTPSWLLSSNANSKATLQPYETIVGVDGSTNGVVGQQFYVYYGYFFRWPHDGVDLPKHMRWLYRQKVTLNAAGFDRNAVSLSTDASKKQGENGVRYQEYDGTAYTDMTWSDSDQRWHGTSAFSLLDSIGWHPDGNRDSVRVWTAPRAGTVRVGADLDGIRAGGGSGADGVRVKIVKNGLPVWPATGYAAVEPASTLPFEPVDMTVAAGDRIAFHVNQNVTSAYDTTLWLPTLTYTGGSRVSWSGNGDFGGVQGAAQWSYEEYDEGAGGTPMTWDAAQQLWHGTAPYLQIGPVSQHADGNRESVRAWVAPRAGRVRITSALGDLYTDNGSGADGVLVRLTRNGTNVWPSTGRQKVGPVDRVPFPMIELSVAAGDTLRFHQHQNGTSAYDTTNWVPKIAYQP